MHNSAKQGVQNSAFKATRDPRKYPRRSYIKSVFFKCHHRHYKGLIINISRSGVFIETKNKFFFGQAIELVIPNIKIDKSVILKGWIVRLSQNGFGVTFKRILERRSGKERRSDLDRRTGLDRRDSRKRIAQA
jgi:Tfp pilus assembly protein PilZ